MTAPKRRGRLPWLGWIVVVLALLNGGWMAFDGARALTVGDYVTPSTGKDADQLGPWTHVVTAVGIEPRSTLMKWIFVVYGSAWIAATICFVARVRGAWMLMLIAAIGALWYLMIGTVFSVLQIVILLITRREM